MSTEAKPTTRQRLADCPNRPNCVCTQASQAARRMPPIAFACSPTEAIQHAADCVAAMPRTRIVSQQDNYLQVEFRSRLFRFVDDVEFLADADTRLLHFRSASRLGYSDLGANRERMERLAKALATRLSEQPPIDSHAGQAPADA